MSRIGKLPIIVPKDVTIRSENGSILVKGPKGELQVAMPGLVKLTQDGNTALLTRTGDERPERAIHGFIRAELNNAIIGVTKGWSKVLELSGVGYRASIQGQNLILVVGFSHPVSIVPPSGITFTVEEGKVIVSGINKQVVGQVASSVRAVKKPEPYKGKGIKYLGERIRKKAGKSAKAVGGAPGAK